MSTSQIEIVRRFYAALGRADVPGVLATLSDAVEWTEAERFPYYTGTWHGPQAVLDNLLVRVANDCDGFGAEPFDFIADSAKVLEALR